MMQFSRMPCLMRSAPRAPTQRVEQLLGDEVSTEGEQVGFVLEPLACVGEVLSGDEVEQHRQVLLPAERAR